ncbi:hypothetical protein YC2023_006726 [Brassica napus]
MSPKLRSIFAQVHLKSLSMGSRRDFSSSSAASKRAEWDNLFSPGISVKLGFAASACFAVYKVYKNYYPKFLICREEHERMLQRHKELWAQSKLDELSRNVCCCGQQPK